MKEKLQHLINSEEKLTRSGFADMLGIQPATISHILAGRNKPSYELLQKILMRFPNVSADWLMLDRGDMLRNPALTPSGMPRRDASDSAAAAGDASQLHVSSDGTARAGEIAAADVRSAVGLQGRLFGGVPSDGGYTQRVNPSSEPQTPRESNISGADAAQVVSSQSHAGSHVERVVIFYSDKSFDTYIPKK